CTSGRMLVTSLLSRISTLLVITSIHLFFQLLILIFFFSSRRRHTSFSRDWSSDVCSSDLAWEAAAEAARQAGIRVVHLRTGLVRSEERRVGKECRCRWWPCRLK